MLRSLSGHEERGVNDTDSLTAMSLVESLIVESPLVSLRKKDIIGLPIYLRDQILVHLYCDNFPSTIEADVRCTECAEQFSFQFDLLEFQNQFNLARVSAVADTKNSWRRKTTYEFELHSGHCFDFPCGKHEIELMRVLAQGEQAALVEYCHTGEAQLTDEAREQFNQLVEKLAPPFDFALTSQCKECGAQNDLDFCMQDYLLQKIIAENSNLNRHIHLLADRYGWSLQEILTLTRQDRRALCELILEEEFD